VSDKSGSNSAKDGGDLWEAALAAMDTKDQRLLRVSYGSRSEILNILLEKLGDIRGSNFLSGEHIHRQVGFRHKQYKSYHVVNSQDLHMFATIEYFSDVAEEISTRSY
jgi:hypothetical protein